MEDHGILRYPPWMKLSDYARSNDIGYRAAWNRFKAGKIPGAWQDDLGAIHVPDPDDRRKDRLMDNSTVVYARVSDHKHGEALDAQADRAVEWAIKQGLYVIEVVKEVGSGVSDTRPKLHKLLQSDSYTNIVVEHKDRLTRFGFAWFQTFAASTGKKIIVMNPRVGDLKEVKADLASVVYSLTEQLYGQRRAAQAKERLLEELRPDRK
jgi:predicted site-specific integrase-resolvase